MRSWFGRLGVVPTVFASVALLVELLPGLLGAYGPFIDELYYVSCSMRPALGYVDHPPLAMLLLAVWRAVLGEGLLALRLPTALTGALVVLGVGVLARRLGAGRFGQAVACGAMLAAPMFGVLFGFYSMNAFEVAIWFACGWILITIEQRGDERLWILFGVVAGVGLLDKQTVVLLALALGVGLLLTPARRHLARPWIWLGAAVALGIASPNLLWQATHGWPSLEFYRNAHLDKNVAVSPIAALLLQVLFVNPVTLPVWGAGLMALLRRRGPVDLRHLGVMSLALLGIVLFGGENRPDRIAGMYPLLFAVGGAAWDSIATRRRGRAFRVALPACLVLGGIALAPLGTPWLPPDALVAYTRAIHFQVQIERGAGKRTQLPQWFADRLGWQQLVDDVAAARAKLTPEEQQQVVYFAPSYGQASALDWLGRDRGLRPVYCTHNSWYLWGPPRDPVSVAIVLGNDPQRLGVLFEDVELAGIYDCDFCMPWRDQMPIWIVRRARGPIAAHWAEWKHFE